MKMLQLKLVLIFIWLFFAVVVNCDYNCDDYDDPLIVKTSHGLIKGAYQTTILKNKTIIAFKGIPYAQPPIGDKRYKVSLCSYNSNFLIE